MKQVHAQNRLIALLLAVTMLLSAAACGGRETSDPAAGAGFHLPGLPGGDPEKFHGPPGEDGGSGPHHGSWPDFTPGA